jgi:hypothetical protein
MYILVGFGRACAPVRCAHPSFGTHCLAKRALRAPPAHRSVAASYSTPKNIYNLSNLARLRQGLFLSTETMKYEVPCPAPPRPSQLRLSFRQYFWGQIMFFYIFTVCCITDMHINDIHISVILRGFSRGPIIHLGSKL